MTPPQRKEERPLGTLLAPDILALLEEAPGSVATETEEMHPADLADVAEAIPRERVAELLRALPADRAADVLEYLDEDLRAEVLEAMSSKQAAQIVTQMTPDDRADVLDELEEETAEEILAEIPTEARRETERLLAYDPDTAGGLMTTEFVSVPETLTVEEALALVRAAARAGRKEAMYAIYATDEQGRLHGVMSLRELLAAPEGARVSDTAWSEVVTLPTSADREEVARVTANYGLVAVPVVDEDGRVVGVVTVDDVIDVLQEEQTEDVQKLGGMEALDEPYMQIGFVGMLRKRAGWLSILMVSEMLTTSALQHFDVELQKVAVLTLFIPLVMSSGGNSGSQATSLVTRAMALKEVDLGDWWRVALRELPSGVALGAILGVIAFARVLLWQAMHDRGWHVGPVPLGYDYGAHHHLVALTVAAALIGIVTFGSLAGSMLPFVLRRLGFDPASASAPFVATLVDVTGLSIYFYVALVILRGTLL
jgi:magnesium transporter